MSIVDSMCLVAAQSWYRVDGLFDARQTNFDDIRVDARLDLVTDEPRRNGVDPAADTDGAPLAHHRTHARVLGQLACRQRAKGGALDGDLLRVVGVELLFDDARHERKVGIDRRELTTTTQEERLVEPLSSAGDGPSRRHRFRAPRRGGSGTP